MKLSLKLLGVAVGLLSSVTAQLAPSTYHIGPLTSRATKAATKTCNVLNYGAKADKSTDIGPPLASAFAACKSGGNVYIPPGNYAMATWVTLDAGNAWSLQLDGIIYRTGTASGNMIAVTNANDFELYSSTSKGAIQGYGYVFHAQGTYGPRLMRITDSQYFSVHDIMLIDAPQFHLTLDTATGAEVYNMIIRGGNEGGLDGIDVSGFNVHIHDVEVTNKDECVTVKNPSNHMLIENIYCNWSGGCAIGSLGADTDISKIQYNNIYTWQSNQMMMLKSNGGSGNVSDCTFSNFIGHSNAYSLDINGYWTDATAASGNGVLYTGLIFSNWKGTCAAGATRAPINVICPDKQPCDGITIEDFAMWTDSGSYELYKCESAWGSGGCLRGGSAHTSFAVSTMTVTAAPSGYSAPKMASDLASGFPISSSIPIPSAIPTSFYPGAKPASALLGS